MDQKQTIKYINAWKYIENAIPIPIKEFVGYPVVKFNDDFLEITHGQNSDRINYSDIKKLSIWTQNRLIYSRQKAIFVLIEKEQDETTPIPEQSFSKGLFTKKIIPLNIEYIQKIMQQNPQIQVQQELREYVETRDIRVLVKAVTKIDMYKLFWVLFISATMVLILMVILGALIPWLSKTL